MKKRKKKEGHIREGTKGKETPLEILQLFFEPLSRNEKKTRDDKFERCRANANQDRNQLNFLLTRFYLDITGFYNSLCFYNVPCLLYNLFFLSYTSSFRCALLVLIR